MNAILFLIRARVKNFFKQLVRRPGALILYIVFAGLILFSIIVSAGRNVGSGASARWLLGPAGTALGAMTLLYPLFQGVSKGGTFFSMADVGLLFPSPVKPKTILMYGIVNQMTTVLFLSIILLAQTSNLRMWFGLSLRGAVVVILTVMIAVYTINVACMLVYAVCASRPEWRPRFAVLGRAGIACLAAAILFAFMEARNPAAAAELLMGNALLSGFPVIGWTKTVFEAADTGGVNLLLPLFGLVGFAVAATVALAFVSADFYEDVLDATEKRQSQLADKRAGKTQDVVLFKRGLRLKMRGHGASALFFRQLCEYARRGFLDLMTLVLIFVIAIMRIAMGDAVDVLGERFFVLMLAYMMMFFNMQGLWSRELQKPFIYLLPARPIAKILYSALLGPFKAFVDGALLGLVLVVFARIPVVYLPVYALSAAAFSAVYTAGDVLSRAILGDSSARMVTMLIYILLSVVLVAPGCILLFVFESILLGCLACAAWCFAGAAVVMALCGKAIFEFQAGA